MSASERMLKKGNLKIMTSDMAFMLVSIKMICSFGVVIQLTNSVAPEPEGSSPHTQQPANDPYPEPGESTPHPPTNLPKVHFDPILPSTHWSSKWFFPSGFPRSSYIKT
jgi:hypothetical protein